jgi:hypothetical protein
MVIIFSCVLEALALDEHFRKDLGVLDPKMDTEVALTDDGIDVLDLARDFAELRLADLDELLKLGVLGGAMMTGVSGVVRSCCFSGV